MGIDRRWVVSRDERKELVAALTKELPTLRAKADISQDELATVIGVSRQTYGAIERKNRDMSWDIYLSLIFFFDSDMDTQKMLRSSGAYPEKLVRRFNGGTVKEDIPTEPLFDADMTEMMDKLDEQAKMSIRAMIMLEYARCTATPGEAVIKAFDGLQFRGPAEKERKTTAQKALRSIRRRRYEK